MTGRVLDLARGFNGKQRLTLELDGDFRAMFDKLKEKPLLDVDIKVHREKRSKDANAYFHLLCGKIAEQMGLGLEEVKTRLVTEYGALDRDENGMVSGAKVPATVDMTKYYRYIKFYDTRTENGKEFNCYLMFKSTHEMNTKEFTRLIDGAIREAQELGIETDTPEQLEKMRTLWAQAERSNR